MKIVNFKLTMNHAGLGALNEYRLMLLFGNAHSLYLTEGCANNPDQIVDSKNNILYPAYFMTHLIVPPQIRLSSFRLWDTVELGIDVKQFGDTILESQYILGKKNQIPQNIQASDVTAFPRMKANSLFVIDASVTRNMNRQTSIPKSGTVSSLEKLKQPPIAIKNSKSVRNESFFNDHSIFDLTTHEPIEYTVYLHRDADPGQAMVFAKFVEIMNYAEIEFFTNHLKPGLPESALSHLEVLEREIYYYGNCFAGEKLEIYIKGQINNCPQNYHGDSMQYVSSSILLFSMEIYQKRDNALLAVSRVKKFFLLPIALNDLLQDINRILYKRYNVI